MIEKGDRVRLALPKGRMKEGVLALLAGAGIEISASSRGYRPAVNLEGFEAKVLKPQNIVEMLALGSRDSIGLLVDPDGRRVATLMGHTRALDSVAWSPDGAWLLTSAYDTTIQVWDREGQALWAFRNLFEGEALYGRWRPDGEVLALFSQDSPELLLLPGSRESLLAISHALVPEEAPLRGAPSPAASTPEGAAR